ncbi:MAG: helix-turn-helix domain-containing protein [Alphaproteobacteria bacterium]|nr:helix-turn-helix domain-containing protein [Alphaproteobacteria bacterium]
MAGLRDAIAYAKGDLAKGKPRRVAVPQVDVRVARRRLSMSQSRFAHAFGVSVATVRNWEQGRRQPEGPARVLLAVIAHSPGAVLEALEVRTTPKRRARDALT